MSDRYQVLEATEPAIYRCRECALVLTNTRVHDRWHDEETT